MRRTRGSTRRSPASTASSTPRRAATTGRARGTTSRSGYGHDEAWWRGFVDTLADVGYDGVLSIEHEDPAMSAVEGVEKSVALLRRVLGARASAIPPPRRTPPVPADSSSRRVVIFDLGGVLIDWDPRNLYRKLFAGDEAAMEAFLSNVCTVEWNERQDAGRTFAEAVAELLPRHADKVESDRGVRPTLRRDDHGRGRRHRRHPRGSQARAACRAMRSPTGRPRPSRRSATASPFSRGSTASSYPARKA